MSAAGYLSAVQNIYGQSATKALTLNGNVQDNVIHGGVGNDNLCGGTGDDVLYGGAGRDTLVYYTGYGNETIADYVAGDDTIKLASGSITQTEMVASDRDVKFTVGEESITV